MSGIASEGPGERVVAPRRLRRQARRAAAAGAPDDLLTALLRFAYDGPGGRRWQITRLCMYRTLSDRLAALDGPEQSCMCISSSQTLARIAGLRQAKLEVANYPDVNLIDLPYPDGRFDFLVSDQVLEHVEGDPFRAVAESLRVLRPGGQAIHTTCFVNEVHGSPNDFWRFTPQALELLGTSAGGEVVLSGGWGNRAALTLIGLGFRMVPIPEDPANPLYQLAMRNEPDFPIVTWVILRKPGTAALIEFRHVSKAYPTRGRPKVVLNDFSLTLARGATVGVLGRNGAGKSTLLGMIAGTVRPDTGEIRRHASISWPLGFSGSFHPDLTGTQNVRFVARIYGADTDALVDYVQDFAELGDFMDMPVRSYSSGMKARLAFGMSMGVSFDWYLVDEITAVGDAAFRAKSLAVFKSRLRDAGMLMTSHSPSVIRSYCRSGLVLEDGEATYFEDVEAAIAEHERNMAVA